MDYTKVVVLNKIYNFVSEKVLIRCHLEFQIYICFMFKDFDIQNSKFLNHLEYSYS